MRVRPIIRHPRPDESLTSVLGPFLEKWHWSLDNVWVAEHRGDLIAAVIAWDSGHDAVHLSNLVVREDLRLCGIGKHLLDGVLKDLKERGRKIVLSETQSIEMAYWAKKRGAVISSPAHLMMLEIT